MELMVLGSHQESLSIKLTRKVSLSEYTLLIETTACWHTLQAEQAVCQ